MKLARVKFSLLGKLISFRSSNTVRNSFWGFAANGFQSILMSLFYVILARKYITKEFSYFLIANTIYQFLAAISNLGLGQWFTREVVSISDHKNLVNRFLKLQVYSGLFFYIINLMLAFILYSNTSIRVLIILLGINIIFDNIIYAIKCLNIARFEQNITFKILVIDSFLKFFVACILFIYPLSIVSLSLCLIFTRFLTLNFFLKFGSFNNINIIFLYKYKITWNEIKLIIFKNWPFLVMGSVSIIYWRIGNIIISKSLTLLDVANYEISFRVFSIAQILPMIVVTSLYPQLIEIYNKGNVAKFREVSRKYLILSIAYGMIMYTLIYSFADFIIPFTFGRNYLSTAACTKQMFLTILLFPSAVLQAVMLTAMKLEKKDMFLNLISLSVSILISIIGLMLIKSLAVINISIFISFLVFHICQDVILVNRKITTIKIVSITYAAILVPILFYHLLALKFPTGILFLAFWTIIIVFFGVIRRVKWNYSPITVAKRTNYPRF